MSLQERLLNLKPVNLFDYKEEFSEFLALEQCQQDGRWHAEGNVLIHTNMVLAEAFKLFPKMRSDAARLSVYLACLLHDFGKPFTTAIDEKKGTLMAKGHESAGVSHARDFLKKYFKDDFDFPGREWILSLVEYHGHPKRMVKDNHKDIAFKQLSLETDLELLYFVEVADFTGRTGISGDESLAYLEKFKEKAQSLSLWNNDRYEVPNTKHLKRAAYNAVKWQVLMNNLKEDNIEKITAIEKQMDMKPFVLVLPIGAPGSGKSTHLQTLYPHVERISMDDERARLGNVNDMSRNEEVYNTCFAALKQRMEARESTIWDATSVDRKRRRLLIDLARRNGAQVVMIYFDLSLETILVRNAGRERKVPEDVIRKFYNRLEVPRLYEYDHLLVVDETTPRAQ